MVMTTTLHTCELNQPHPVSNVNELLKELRERTGRDWQICGHPIFVGRKWVFGPYVYKTRYCLYLYVGGVLPWQQLTIYPDSPDSRDDGTAKIVGYMTGYLSGLRHGQDQRDATDAIMSAKLKDCPPPYTGRTNGKSFK